MNALYVRLALADIEAAFAPWGPPPGEPETETSRLDREAFNAQDRQHALIRALAAVAWSNLAAARRNEQGDDYAQ